MRILYVVGQFPSGSETFVAEEIAGLRRRGHDITVVSLKRPDMAEQARFGPALQALMPGTHYVPRLTPGAVLAFGWRTAAWRLNARLAREATAKVRPLPRLARAMVVAQLARETRAEWIHAHWPRPTEVAMLAAKMTGLPISVSIHAHEVAHDAAHFSAAFEMLRFASFCNEAAMNRLLDTLGDAARAKSHLVYHGVDVCNFPATPLPPLDQGLRVVSAGRLTGTKGFARLIRAIAQARVEGLNVFLTIYGEGGARPALEGLIKDLGVEAAVTLAGWLPHEDMPKALARHHVFALMADDGFHDGLPNVVLEAMSLGRPALLSPLPAAREVVESGVNGFILGGVDNRDELVRHLRALQGNAVLLDRLGNRASQSVREHHDRGQRLDALGKLFG